MTWTAGNPIVVKYAPGVTTAANIVDAINTEYVNDGTFPVDAALVGGAANTGSGVIGDDLVDNEYATDFMPSFFVPEDAVPGDTYTRFRVSSDGLNADGRLLGTGGLARSGEVEDHVVAIEAVDYGDAPNQYHTILDRDIYGNVISNGARHVIAGPWLGQILTGETKAHAVDHDVVGMPGPAADGDDTEADLEYSDLADYTGDYSTEDLEGYADEDGIDFVQQIVPGEEATVNVTMERHDFDGKLT